VLPSEGEPIQNSGTASFVARARLMLQLGDQLITDEVAAVFELVKNSYDADASEVVVDLENVSNAETGRITIKDDGIGMTKETLLTAWLELGTPNKAKNAPNQPRVSAKGRIYLGEKGLGRLAVHKLGLTTEIVTKVEDGTTEAVLRIDWTSFEDPSKFLSGVPVQWQVRPPETFVGSGAHGTLITVRHLHRDWSTEMMRTLKLSVSSMISPLAGIKEFKPSLNFNDTNAPEVFESDISGLLQNVPFRFSCKVDSGGNSSYSYRFQRQDFPDINRDPGSVEKDIRNPDFFKARRPKCGPFEVQFYAWELWRGEKKYTFGDTAIYEEVIRPNTGVKVFRDGFRVLPYGEEDNDWLGLDSRRVGQFEERVSRNIMIGIVTITAKDNPQLQDKSDREGLIGNEAFEDFKELVLDAITVFEAERFSDRRKLKEKQGRIETIETKFSKKLAHLEDLLSGPKIKMPSETKFEIMKSMVETRESFEDSLQELEEPLLTAAAIGLTYMVPTHEVRRDLQEANKGLREVLEKNRGSILEAELSQVLQHVRFAQEMVTGIARIMQQPASPEKFPLVEPAKTALGLMKNRLRRNKIEYELVEGPEVVEGDPEQLASALINMLDNSVYWVAKTKDSTRRIKLVIAEYRGSPAVVVSDNGPGFEDDLALVTSPFFTRKPGGMGLGLYICDRIARNQGGQLQILKQSDMDGLLQGANIAIVMPEQQG
jgi:signal transduction histidine kinase